MPKNHNNGKEFSTLKSIFTKTVNWLPFFTTVHSLTGITTQFFKCEMFDSAYPKYLTMM